MNTITRKNKKLYFKIKKTFDSHFNFNNYFLYIYYRNLYVLYLYLIYQQISADFTVLVLNIQMLQQLRRSFCTFVYEKN